MKHLRQQFDYGNDKKSLLVICGIHGNETNAIASTMDVRDRIRKNPMFEKYGRITFLIGVNEYGIRYDYRKTGREYDTTDLNRMFYEVDDYKKMVLQEIEAHDIIVDVHNSPNITNCVLLTFDKYVSGYKKFLDDKGIFNMVWNVQTPNIKNKANSYEDKMGFTIELDGMGDTSFEVAAENEGFLYNFIDSVWECKKTVNDMPDTSIISEGLISNYEGMLYWFKARVFEKDEVVALVRDYEGKVLERIKAPYRCIMAAKNDSLFIREGESIGNMVEI